MPLQLPKFQSDYEKWLYFESQAAHLIRKFGGPYPLARKIGYDPSQVFRWRYPERPHPKRGTGGTVPRKALDKMLSIARAEGVLLTEDDTRIRHYRGDKQLEGTNRD
jgi:hypothetical protein